MTTKNKVINHKLLINGVCAAILFSFAPVVVMVGCVLVLSTMQYGWEFASETMFELITTDGMSQFIIILIIAVCLIPSLYIGIVESFEEIPKQRTVRIGARYRDLKKLWVNV